MNATRQRKTPPTAPTTSPIRRLQVSQPVPSLNLSRQQLDDLLDRLDAAARNRNVQYTTRRRFNRRSTRLAAMYVKVESREADSAFLVPLRDISEGGAAFLHRSMIHPGTRCSVRIRLAGGQPFSTTGRIVRCRHVNGLIHELGLQFDELIDLDAAQQTQPKIAE